MDRRGNAAAAGARVRGDLPRDPVLEADLTWSTQSAWLDVGAASALYAAGAILFGRFEDHKPRGWRLLKFVLVLALFAGLVATAGRGWAWVALLVPALAAAWAHLVWLPRNGINGWTGEPRERYLELIRSRNRRG